MDEHRVVIFPSIINNFFLIEIKLENIYNLRHVYFDLWEIFFYLYFIVNTKYS